MGNENIKKMLEEADKLEHVVKLLQGHIDSLRGKEIDNIGMKQMALFELERILNVKIISQECYDNLIMRDSQYE